MDFEELSLDFGLLNLLSQLCCLFEGILVVFHGEEVLLNLSQICLKIVELLLLLVLQIGHEFDLLVVAGLGLLIALLLRVLRDLVVLVRVLSAHRVVVQVAHLAFQSGKLLSVILGGQDEGLPLLPLILLEVLLVLFQFPGLVFDNLQLGVQDELLSLHLE